jgi:hypothetical protein
MLKKKKETTKKSYKNKKNNNNNRIDPRKGLQQCKPVISAKNNQKNTTNQRARHAQKGKK